MTVHNEGNSNRIPPAAQSQKSANNENSQDWSALANILRRAKAEEPQNPKSLKGRVSY